MKSWNSPAGWLVVVVALVVVWSMFGDEAELAAWIERAAVEVLEVSADAQGVGP